MLSVLWRAIPIAVAGPVALWGCLVATPDGTPTSLPRSAPLSALAPFDSAITPTFPAQPQPQASTAPSPKASIAIGDGTVRPPTAASDPPVLMLTLNRKSHGPVAESRDISSPAGPSPSVASPADTAFAQTDPPIEFQEIPPLMTESSGGQGSGPEASRPASSNNGLPRAAQRPSDIQPTLEPIPQEIAGPGLSIVEAIFTNLVAARVPGPPLTRFDTKKGRLWFWMKVACRDACASRLKKNGGLQLSIHWLGDTTRGSQVRDVYPVAIHGTEWRTWMSKSNLSPGRWRVTVRDGTTPVCLSDQTETCEFVIQVE